ncbi:helix-hairpin-helix domain-containing protein [Catellatospora vulcania]|uniref:DNA-binding protein n=1 Tax=Catellatospora vulcania TaxID=1460450 RepID=UPI0012D4914C|nr:DNA-binding protein [Catellatospora vulcania]
MSAAAGDEIPKISAPANRALDLAGHTTLAAISQLTKKDLLDLHGVGPKAIRILREALAEHGLTFADERK